MYLVLLFGGDSLPERLTLSRFNTMWCRLNMIGGLRYPPVYTCSGGCDDRGAPHFFSEVPQFGSLRYVLTQTLIWRKIKPLPDEKSHGLGTQHNEKHAKQNGLLFIYFPTILGSGDRPVIQKPLLPKKGIPLHRVAMS